MSSHREQLVMSLHASGQQAVLAVTGGGGFAISDLLTVPGASAFVLEARVPYSTAALAEWLGREPEQSCSRETALAMAVVAWQRASQLAGSSAKTIGVGCTASLVSSQPKRGDHRAWIATHSATATRLYGLTLAKGQRDRTEEERLVADALLQLLGESCEVAEQLDIRLGEGETLTRESAVAPQSLVELLTGQRSMLWFAESTWFTKPPAQPLGLLSGAFNPLHEGHREMAGVAEARLGGQVAFELAVVNVDKPPLDFLTIEARCQQFRDRPVVLTCEPTFVRKSRLFPNTTFVVGFDTAERIVQPKYYGGECEMLAALTEISSLGCRFMVAGRRKEDQFRTLTELTLPPQAQALFEEIPESTFRRDVSSTELRQQSSPPL